MPIWVIDFGEEAFTADCNSYLNALGAHTYTTRGHTYYAFDEDSQCSGSTGNPKRHQGTILCSAQSRQPAKYITLHAFKGILDQQWKIGMTLKLAVTMQTDQCNYWVSMRPKSFDHVWCTLIAATVRPDKSLLRIIIISHQQSDTRLTVTQLSNRLSPGLLIGLL